MGQDRSKMGQHGAKMGQDRAKIGPRWAKIRQHRPKMWTCKKRQKPTCFWDRRQGWSSCSASQKEEQMHFVPDTASWSPRPWPDFVVSMGTPFSDTPVRHHFLGSSLKFKHRFSIRWPSSVFCGCSCYKPCDTCSCSFIFKLFLLWVFVF